MTFLEQGGIVNIKVLTHFSLGLEWRYKQYKSKIIFIAERQNNPNNFLYKIPWDSRLNFSA
jgi:hypothetical protein